MSIQDILGGGGGGGAPGGGPPASIQVGGGSQDSSGGGASGVDDLIQQALDALRKAAQAPDADHEDKLAIEKMTTLGQQILTTNQKMQDNAMGGSDGTRMIRKATGAQSAASGSGSGY